MKSPNVILLVEDDPNDAFFFERALEAVGYPGKLRHFTDADLAKQYLSGGEPFADRIANPEPELIIADSALAPRGSGVELLEWIRSKGIVPDAPFVILSGGLEDSMRERAEAAGVRRILVKASSYKKTAEQLRQIFSTLPPEKRAWLK